MKVFANLILSFTLVSTVSLAQTNNSLTGNFGQMKDKAQTFKDYKVIKEVTLNAFWKSVEDSLADQRQKINQANVEIAGLKDKIVQVEAEAKRKEEAVAEIVFDSEHITVAGIAFHKAVFISIFFIAIAGLVALVSLLWIRSAVLSKSLKDKSESMLILSSEFEEYKHRAVEKQMKLSRELQDERNRLADLKIMR